MRRTRKASFDTKLIIFGVLANAIVKQVPPLVNKVITLPASLNPLIGTAVAVGAGYFMGSHELFNLGIASGASIYVNQALNMVTGGTADANISLTTLPASSGTLPATTSPLTKTSAVVSDYYHLNDYSNNPVPNKQYFNQYAYN
jgi:hypothetical protein